jgi:plasmid stabilization system protein ParE
MTIPIRLALEDILSEAVLRRCWGEFGERFEVGPVHSRGGWGYLKKRLPAFQNAASFGPILLLTDLDAHPCVAALRADWDEFRRFAGFRRQQLNRDIESIPDPKHQLLRLVAESRNRELRYRLVHQSRQELRQGPDYNGALIDFVVGRWNPQRARQLADSLDRMLLALERFGATWRG